MYYTSTLFSLLPKPQSSPILFVFHTCFAVLDRNTRAVFFSVEHLLLWHSCLEPCCLLAFLTHSSGLASNEDVGEYWLLKRLARIFQLSKNRLNRSPKYNQVPWKTVQTRDALCLDSYAPAFAAESRACSPSRSLPPFLSSAL